MNFNIPPGYTQHSATKNNFLSVNIIALLFQSCDSRLGDMITMTTR